MSILPNKDQIKGLLEWPEDTPVCMVNILRFKDGKESAYKNYSREVFKLVEKIGGKIIFSSKIDSMVIGEMPKDYHQIAIVEYPSRKAFIEMSSSEEYKKIHHFRKEGLESQWLIATTSNSLS